MSALHMARCYAGRHRYLHPVWVVDHAINTSGRIRVLSRSRPWLPSLPGTLQLYPPNTLYWTDYPEGGKSLCEFSFVFFRGGEAVGLDKLIPPRAGFARFLDPDGLAGATIEEIARIGQKQGTAGFWQAQAGLCRLIDLLLASAPSEHDEPRRIGHPASFPAPTPSALVRATEDYLRRHLAQPVALAELAQQLQVSVSTLSHRYRAETGETPMTRLMQLRMNHAKILLTSGQKLSAIVEATGFCDSAHFSRAFKRLEGVSPREYLRDTLQPELRYRAND